MLLGVVLAAAYLAARCWPRTAVTAVAFTPDGRLISTPSSGLDFVSNLARDRTRSDELTATASMNKASLKEKFALIEEHWRPKVVARLNGQELKLVKFAGVFPWHYHEDADEMFLVWRGQMTIKFRDRRATLEAGWKSLWR